LKNYPDIDSLASDSTISYDVRTVFMALSMKEMEQEERTVLSLKEYCPSRRFNFFQNYYLFACLHILAVLTIFLFPPTLGRIAVALMMIFLTGCLGITLTFHRALTHRAFKFKFKWLERIFTTFATAALEQGPIWWTGLHRVHHKYSDTERDPHNRKKGFLYSHFLWHSYLDKRWEKPHRVENFREMARDIAMDPYYVFLDRFFYLPFLASLGILYLLGGWPWVFWGGFLGIPVVWHFTWFVNSVTHRYGYRNFATWNEDDSTNNWMVALVTFGEGWHNNHHAFPASPKNGFFRWWEMDITYLIILLLEKMRLVYDLKRVSEEQIHKAEQVRSSNEVQ